MPIYAVRITNLGHVWHLGRIAGRLAPMPGTMGAAVFQSREAAQEALQLFLYNSYGSLISSCGDAAIDVVTM